MKSQNGLRGYFYEYLYHQSVDRAREQTSEVIPISQAKAIRGRVDEILSEQGTSMKDPDLSIPACLTAVDQAFGEKVRDYEPQFGDHTSNSERYQKLQREFSRFTGIGERIDPGSVRLPISPYDPEWADRSTVRKQGTALSYIPDDTIERKTGGRVDELSDPRHGDMVLWGVDENNKSFEAGRAMTLDDASGLTVLMDKMSEREYDQVRDWVIDGGRNPATGKVERSRFMSSAAVARSAAVLEDLKQQGLSYEISRDRNPGQIKASIKGSRMEMRLTDMQNEAYAGARIYDNGTEIRYSTTHRVRGGIAVYSPSPSEAVDLLHFAQGREVSRRDLPEWKVGEIGLAHQEHTSGRTTRMRDVADSHYADSGSRFVVDDYQVPGQDTTGSKVLMRRDGKKRTLPMFFGEQEAAEDYVRGAVDSARENLRASLDVEGLIEHFDAQLGQWETADEIEPPEFSSDTEIAAIQHSYWEVLTGEREDLLRPGATEDMHRERLEEIGESPELDFGNLVYGGTSSDKVRAHASDVSYELVGTFEAELHDEAGQWVDRRFDPSRVAKYMTSATGQWSNLDNLGSALRRLEVPADELMGSDFQANRFKDRLVRFDETSATNMADHDSPFIRRMGDVIHESITHNGARLTDDIRIDEQGVISWQAEKFRSNGSTTPISGEIGQVFDVGDHGEIVTQFASGENALVVPGYEARISADIPGQTPTSVEERTTLRGYEQLMSERLRYQISNDLIPGRSQVGEPASLNPVYSQLYGTKHPVDFIERATSHELDETTGEITGKLDDWTATILETEAKRVRYSNEVEAESTIYAEYRAKRDKSDPADDNHFDAWQLTGGRNMTVLTGRDAHGIEAPKGYFDPMMTGGATNQGIVRYLTADAEVGPDGRIIPGDPSTTSGERAPLMARPEMETLRYDPFDRQQMAASTIMQSSEVSEPTGTALMTFGGWTADDPIVVSQEFAEEHQIRGAGGELRSLVVGDKISDLHGNKGVLSLIVDRDMDLDEARDQGLEEEVRWFSENPDMDVVMSPFSLISRRNAGAARELMEGETKDVVTSHTAPGFEPALDEAVPGALGDMRFVVTHMAVDEKTKIYDDEEVRAGRGRRASAQLAWALQSQDCPAIMREFYGHNSGAEANLREYLLVSGMDMDADGSLRMVGQDEPGPGHPQRRLIEMPELQLTKPRGTSRPGLNTAAMRRSFGELIGDRGGDMEIPFPLTYPTGEQTESVSATSWKLPVMSSHLRSGQEFENGTSVTHDYTHSYQDVFIEACQYRHKAAQLEDEDVTPERREELRTEMDQSASKAQRALESITTDVKNRVLTGKNNIFKTGIMSSRLSDSATMVWTADPRLDIDQVALPSAKAEQLGLAEGDHAMIWRDPVLRDAGVRYMRVAIDDRLTGAAINPVMDQCFDGDFDGDSVAVVKLHTPAAQAEALEKLSVPANLLDKGVIDEKGEHPLAMQRSLDTQVALSKNPELSSEFDDLGHEANLIAKDARSGEYDASDILARREDVTAQLSDAYRQAQRSEFGAALRFDGREEHLQSIREVCIETGAKGSEKKLAGYERNLGDESGTPGITQTDQEASMYATAIKAHGTGLGGSYSQRAVRALRGTDLSSVLEVTYPVTQSILQAKHDAEEARHKYEALQGPGRDLWRGRKLELSAGEWSTVFEDGEPVQATAEEWKQEFRAFYDGEAGFGVGVNPEAVEKVTAALTGPDGRMRNLEEDKMLRGSVLDRMAYSGEFTDLVDAAKTRESIYDSEKSEQFASAGTRRSIEASKRWLDSTLAQVVPEVEKDEVSASVVKRDVLADTVEQASARGAHRKSAAAVGVGRGGEERYQKVLESITNDRSEQNDGDHEMGL